MAVNLIIDAGNSFVKAALFDGEEMVKVFSFSRGEGWHHELAGYSIHKSIISNVGGHFADFLLEGCPSLLLNETTKLPLINKYATPNTLGKDRLAAAVGANQLFPNKNILVIDSGTCITYDIITAENEFLGGIISPGIQMRLQAMHQFTARLPTANWNPNAPLIGTDTLSCLQSGAANGVLAEAEGIIGRMIEKYYELEVVICGGTTSFFESKINRRIFAAPYLVLQGLNRILIYND